MRELLKKTGNIEQLAFCRSVEYQDGAAAGLLAWQIRNGDLCFSVAKDKCMDILELSYRGINLSFLAKNGLSSGNYARENAFSNKSVMGGMLFTCGTDNVGPMDWKRQLPIHGSLRFTSARHRREQCYFDRDGKYHILVSGVIEPNGLFEGNIVLERTIETVYGSKKIWITDRFRNMGYRREPFLILYHYNFSYPFLEPCCQIKIDSSKTVLREQMEREAKGFLQIEEPLDDGMEQVFFHNVCADEDGKVRIVVQNPRLNMGVQIGYEKQVLPRLIQWKSMVSGDYALGIEPANCLVFGRAYEEEHGTLCYLEGGEERIINMELEVWQN